MLTTENRGFAAANNRGLEVVDAEWVLFLNPDTRILSGTLEELVSLLRRRVRRWDSRGVRQIDENGVMDPTMRRFPECRSLALREPRRGTTCRFTPRGSESVCSTPELYDRETLLRLDRRVVHARTQSCARRRRAYGRAVLPLLRGDRLLPSDATGRVGGRPSSPDDDPPPEQLDRLGREAQRADGVRPSAVHGEAFRARSPTRGNCSRSASAMRLRAHQAGSRRGGRRRRRASARAALSTLVGLAPPPFVPVRRRSRDARVRGSGRRSTRPL